MKKEYEMVENPGGLLEVLAGLEKTSTIALDLEADTLYRYGETACLAQVSDGKRTWLIDLIRLGDIAPLKPVFENTGPEKILHGADYDIRLLRRHFGIECRPVFDTEIAARFLGARRSGLGDILKERFGVSLEKKFQRADWTRRPIPADMRAYAAADVRWLLPLAGEMKRELAALGRLSWVEEECSLLAAAPDTPRGSGPLFTSFKGADLLDRRGLAVLESVLQAREKAARERDRPPFKVLSPDAIRQIVLERPETDRELAGIHGLYRRSPAFRAFLLKAISDALLLPESDLPEYPRNSRPRPPRIPFFQERVQALREWREKKASGLGLDLGLICANSMLHELAARRPLTPGEIGRMEKMRQWQKDEFGGEISAILSAAR